MIFTGTFNNYDNSHTYSVTIGSTGSTTTIVDPLTIPSGTAASDMLVMFADDPVTINTSRDDLQKRIIISQATINLVSNQNLTEYIFANTNRSIPVTITNNDTTCFFGYVDPLQFDQGYAHNWEEIQVNATDPLGALEDMNVGQLPNITKTTTITSWQFLVKILNAAGINTINETVNATVKNAMQGTNVNMAIFFGESEDDYMTLNESLTELCKYWNLYVAYYNNSANISCTIVDNSSQYTITNFKDKAADDSTSLSMDEAYSQVAITAEIEPVEDVVIGYDDDDYLYSDYSNYEKYMTEYVNTNYVQFIRMLTNQDYSDGYKLDNYCYLMKNDLWDFGPNGYTNQTFADQRDVLTWLKNNSGKGAIIGFGRGSKTDPQNNAPVANISLTNYLVISVNGALNNSDAGGSAMESMLQAANPVCSYTGLNSNILSPADDQITNYIVISGKILLNPVQPKTGPVRTEPNIIYNTIADCLAFWNDPDNSLWPNYLTMYTCRVAGGDDSVYYQQYWDRGTYGMFGYLDNNKNQRFEYKYDRPGDSTDRISKLPVIACELKVGDKYCVERLDQGQNGQGKFQWMTALEAANAGITAPVFTIGIDPKIGDKVVGQSFNIQNNVNYKMGIDKTGTAIPIKKSDHLSGTISFKILGPYNLSWTEIDSYSHGWWFWKKTHWTEDLYHVLQYLESIMISNLKIETVSDNGLINKNANPADNDLVYSSNTNPSYIEKLEEDIKICTPLTLQECTDYGVKYQMSNSYIYKTNNDPFYGFQSGSNFIKPEVCLVDYYYKEYNTPARMISTTLKANALSNGVNGQMLTYDMMRMNILGIYPGDSTAYRIMDYETSLKYKTVNVTFREYRTQGQNQL